MRQVTLSFLIKKNNNGKIAGVWLAMKKRGFGKDKWNGCGGKLDPKKGDKKILDTLLRENREEIGIKVKKAEKVAIIDFIFPNNRKFNGWNQRVHVFLISEWTGSPKESEEMKPTFFQVDRMPYTAMWDDDVFWLPAVIVGKKIRARCLFDRSLKTRHFEIKMAVKPL